MKILSAVLCASVGMAVAARGDDMTTLTGQTYHNFQIQQYDRDGYTVLHDDGRAKVPFSEISPELRNHYKALSMIPISSAKMAGEQDTPAGPNDLETLSGQIYRNIAVKSVETSRFLIAHDSGMDTVYFSALAPAMQEKVRRMPVVPDPAPGPNDIVTTYGLVFRNTEITRTEPDGLTFRHTGGVTKLGFPALGEELQQKYNYDPINAWKYGREMAAANRAAAAPAPEPEAPSVPATFEVYAVETQKLEDDKYWVRFSIRNITDQPQVIWAVPCEKKLVAIMSAKEIDVDANAVKELQQIVVPSIAPTYLKTTAGSYTTNTLLKWE